MIPRKYRQVTELYRALHGCFVRVVRLTPAGNFWATLCVCFKMNLREKSFMNMKMFDWFAWRWTRGGTHFNMNGFAWRIVLISRKKATQKWPAGFHPGNWPYSYPRNRTGTSLQPRTMRGNFTNVNYILNIFLMIFPCISLHCKLVPVLHREYVYTTTVPHKRQCNMELLLSSLLLSGLALEHISCLVTLLQGLWGAQIQVGFLTEQIPHHW